MYHQTIKEKVSPWTHRVLIDKSTLWTHNTTSERTYVFRFFDVSESCFSWDSRKKSLVFYQKYLLKVTSNTYKSTSRLQMICQLTQKEESLRFALKTSNESHCFPSPNTCLRVVPENQQKSELFTDSPKNNGGLTNLP